MKYQIVISFETAYQLTPTESKALCEKLRIELDKNPVTITELTLSKQDWEYTIPDLHNNLT